MIQSEEKSLNREAQKSKIRERYKGIDSSELEVVPADPQLSLYDQTKPQNVAVYARVSTDDPRQTSSYELQKNHYHDVVTRHSGWILYKMYADEGISGTSLKHRDAFIEMIKDCQQHKIDLIVTKSVSRFARNVLDCIGYVRQLKALNPPVGVFFETENIYTLDNNSEMSLSFISTLAQEESHNKSEIMNASVEMRFRRGIFLTPALLGYDKDEDGNLVINEEEANTVRLIFFLYLYGYTCAEIAQKLTELGCHTKKNNITWSSGSIFQILTNERHCGDVLARKTFTPNYLDHKSKKNNKDRNQYRKRDHHDAIISRADFIAVQRMIQNAKYKNKGFLPELHVINEGALKGFVSINPRWAGFSLQDYQMASESVYDGIVCLASDSDALVSKPEAGQFNLSEFEVARGQFFTSPGVCQLSISIDHYHFNQCCFSKMPSASYVELLIHPTDKQLVIRKTDRDNRNAINWGHITSDGLRPREVSGAAFLPKIFALMKWNSDYRYQIRGIKHQREDSYISFDLHEAEAFIPLTTEPAASKPPSKVHAYPADWANNFGENYYRQIAPSNSSEAESNWNVQCKGIIFQEFDRPSVTPRSKVIEKIERIVTDIKESSNG